MAAEAEIRRMVVRLIGDGSSYKMMMREAQAITREANRVISQLGPALTKSVTLPLVAMGTTAVKVFADFQHSLQKIQGLAGVSAEGVADLKEEILKLAPAVGKSPLELSEAMANIAGGGIKGAEGLETLRASAKASAAGLGETRVVADAVTSALNAYGPANLKATDAVDQLVAAVREGKAEASTFAPVLGQVLPTANELGVSFDQAAGTIAFLTKSTGSASIAATGLRGVLTQLIRPTKEAEEELTKMGMSTDTIRRSIREQGLHKTLMDLRAAFDAQGVPITKMFADIEGLNAVLQLTGPQAKDAAAVIEAVGDSAGATDSAFGAISKTAKQQFNQAMAGVQVALVGIGDELAKALTPALEKAREVIEKITKAWQGLSPEMKSTILQAGLVVAAIGPLLLAIKGVIAVLGLLKLAFAATGIGAIVLAIGLVVEKTVGWQNALKFIMDLLEAAIDKAMQLAAMLPGGGKAPEETGLLTASGGNIGGGIVGMIQEKTTFAEVRKQFDEIKKQREEAAKLAAEEAKAKERSLGIERELNMMLAEQAEAQKKAAEAEKQRQKAIADTISALKEEVATYGMSRKELALYQAEQMGASDAQKAVIASLQDQLSAKEAATKATEEAREAEKRFQDSIKGFGIEGVGRGMEALARVQESRMLRGSGRDMKPSAIATSPKSVAMKNVQTVWGASAPGGDGVAAQMKIFQRIADNTEKTANKEPVTIKAAGVGN